MDNPALADTVPALSRAALIEALCASAIRAGEAILEVARGDLGTTAKQDMSPVTLADAAAEAIILADLARLAPDIAVVAEEAVSAGAVPKPAARFFLVDPLDGTKEFIGGKPDYTVNIALIDAGVPVMGIVYVPARRWLFVGDGAAGMAWRAEVAADGMVTGRRAIRVRAPGAAGLVAVASASHNTPETDAYLVRCGVAARTSYGSSLKLCMVAAGEADIYPRLGPTMEWDTAAGDAVLRAAGGQVLAPDGQPLLYGKPDYRNCDFVAAGGFVPPALIG
jgi:3'(2'),5'-bisphosphate nucleotidase